MRVCVLAVAAGLLTLPGVTLVEAGSSPECVVVVQPDAAYEATLVSAFLKKVKDYVELHRKLDGTLKEVSSSATARDIEDHQVALQNLLRNARANAKQGEFFDRDTRAYFRRQISRATTGPHGQEIRDSIMEENPRAVRLAVNARYPEGLAFTTTPPQVILLLPRLPDELEYRFVGDRLVLLDSHALTVVDYIEGALGH